MPDVKDILERVERKLDALLRHHEIDLSKEDAQVLAMTDRANASSETVITAIREIPHTDKPSTGET